jgi:hypothetical protein
MAGDSDYTAQNEIDWKTGKDAMPALPTVYLALLTAVGSDDGTGFTEVSGGSYARAAPAGTDWNAASGTGPSTTTNANAIQFPVATADWGIVIAVGAYDAASGGNLLWWDYLGAYAWQPFTCTLASPGVLTAPAHGFADSDQVVVTAEFGGTLPATGGSWSGLKTVASATADTFTAGVNTTGTGNGMVRKVLTQNVITGVQVVFAAGGLTLAQA